MQATGGKVYVAKEICVGTEGNCSILCAICKLNLSRRSQEITAWFYCCCCCCLHKVEIVQHQMG